MTKIKIKDFTCIKKVQPDKKLSNPSKSTQERSRKDMSNESQFNSKRNASVTVPVYSKGQMNGGNENHGQPAREKTAPVSQQKGRQSIPHGIVLHCEQSQVVDCPQCNTVVQTTIIFVPGVCTYLLCLLPIPCSFFTFMFDCTKDAHHFCPRCGYFFGKFQRLNC